MYCSYVVRETIIIQIIIQILQSTGQEQKNKYRINK